MRRLYLFGIWYFQSLCMTFNGYIAPPRGSGAFSRGGVLGVLPVATFGVLMLAFTAWQHWQWSRDPGTAARAEIEKLLSRHAGSGTWVSADGHVRLTARRHGHLLLSEWIVSRAGGDKGAYIDDAGRAVATTETFTFAWFDLKVRRKLDGATGRQHVERSADADELAELAGQFRASAFTPSLAG